MRRAGRCWEHVDGADVDVVVSGVGAEGVVAGAADGADRTTQNGAAK